MFLLYAVCLSVTSSTVQTTKSIGKNLSTRIHFENKPSYFTNPPSTKTLIIKKAQNSFDQICLKNRSLGSMYG